MDKLIMQLYAINTFKRVNSNKLTPQQKICPITPILPKGVNRQQQKMEGMRRWDKIIQKMINRTWLPQNYILRLYSLYQKLNTIRLGPAQDVPFFYTRSHLNALQNCALIFSTNFQFILTFKICTTQFSH